MKANPKKELARMLYLSDPDITQKEIARRCDTSEQSVCTWIKADEWDKLRAAQRMTKGELITKFTQNLVTLQKDIDSREETKRYPTSKEADILRKLQKAIEETAFMPHSQYVDIGKQFLKHIHRVAPEMYAPISDLYDSFIKSILK